MGGSFVFIAMAMVCIIHDVDTNLVNDINVIDMNLRKGLLARASIESIPRADRNKPIDVTLGMEMKKIIKVNELDQQLKIQVCTFQ